MFGTRTRALALLALIALLLFAPLATAAGVETRASPTGFVLGLVDYVIHLVF